MNRSHSDERLPMSPCKRTVQTAAKRNRRRSRQRLTRRPGTKSRRNCERQESAGPFRASAIPIRMDPAARLASPMSSDAGARGLVKAANAVNALKGGCERTVSARPFVAYVAADVGDQKSAKTRCPCRRRAAGALRVAERPGSAGGTRRAEEPRRDRNFSQYFKRSSSPQALRMLLNALHQLSAEKP